MFGAKSGLPNQSLNWPWNSNNHFLHQSNDWLGRLSQYDL